MVVQHVGMGVARRAAEHERRRAEREADDAEIDVPDEDEILDSDKARLRAQMRADFW